MSLSALVTGGCGFIGSHLVEGLLHEGYRVRVLDDLSAGRLENLEACEDDVEVIVGDVRDTGTVERALDGVEVVFHEAAVVSVERSFSEVELVDDVNVGGTIAVLAAAARAGVRRLVAASSAAVYGDASVLPVAESAATMPMSPYGVGKAAIEGYARVLAAEGPEVVCLRYFNVFGPRQDPASDYAGVIARFLACALAAEPYTVFGDGRQTRDFVAVDDVVRANLLAAEAELAAPDGSATGEEVRSVVLNVGSGRQTSLLALMDAVDRVAGRAGGDDHARVRFEPARDGDIRYSQADLAEARRVLGAVPSTTLDDGLRVTWEWFRREAGAGGG